SCPRAGSSRTRQLRFPAPLGNSGGGSGNMPDPSLVPAVWTKALPICFSLFDTSALPLLSPNTASRPLESSQTKTPTAASSTPTQSTSGQSEPRPAGPLLPSGDWVPAGGAGPATGSGVGIACPI